MRHGAGLWRQTVAPVYRARWYFEIKSGGGTLMSAASAHPQTPGAAEASKYEPRGKNLQTAASTHMLARSLDFEIGSTQTTALTVHGGWNLRHGFLLARRCFFRHDTRKATDSRITGTGTSRNTPPLKHRYGEADARAKAFL
ncbi:MAG: hypothetical protein ACRYG5_05740 [Janthinobacterium lividum]